MNTFIDSVIKQYKLVIVITLLITIAIGCFFSNLKLNNTIDMYFEEDDPAVKIHREFRETFGNEEMVLVLFKDDNIFSNKKIEIIRSISKMAKEMKYVHRVFSITEQEEAVSEKDTIFFKKIIPEGMLDQDALAEARQRVLNNKILLQRFISIDGTTTAIMVELEHIGNSGEKIALLNNIKESALKIAGTMVDLRFTGLPFIEAEENTLTVKDFLTFTPLMTVVIFIFLQFILKSYTLNLLSFLTLAVTTVLAVGFFALSGETINLVTSIMPPVLLAIAVADTIHLLAHFKDEYMAANGKGYIETVASATKAIWLPCLFTSLTTAVGFFSFITATIRPVKILGIFTALGVMVAFVMTVTFLPAALVFFRRRIENSGLANVKKRQVTSNNNKDSLLRGLLLEIGRFSTTYRKTIIIVFLLLVLLTIFGATKIKFETNVMNFFSEDNAIVKDLKFIEKNMGGYFNSELLLKATSEEYDFTHPQSVKIINDIQRYFKESDYVSASFSISDYLKEINRAFNKNEDDHYRIPEDQTTIMDYYELGDMDDTERLVSPDRMQARISYQLFSSTNETAQKNIDKFDSYMKQNLGENYSYHITGTGSLWLSMDESLKVSFIKSLLFAFTVIFIMMIYVCKNIKLAILSMVPNLFPIILTIGIMGWFNIPFNSITVMIACVTLGIAVDDTVHFLVWFKRNVESGMDIKSSLLMTYQNVGQPIVITSLILFMGFFILVLGSYKPFNTFGVLTALTILFALITDFVLLPALILVLKPLGEKQVAPERVLGQVKNVVSLE